MLTAVVIGSVGVEQHLRQLGLSARAHEEAGDLAGAALAYRSILRRYPARIEAWLRLSQVERLAGHYRAAVECAHRAAAAVESTREWKLLARVSLQLMHLDELELARRMICDADWSSPEVIRQSPTLSQHLWLSGHYTDALNMIDAASKRVLPSHQLSYSRANALRHCGRLDEATIEFERCIELAPDYAPAHWSLAYHQPSQLAGCRVPRVRAAISATQEGSLDQADLYYALFKELDNLGDTGAAWEALEKGAGIKRRSLQYDAQQHSAGFRLLREGTGHAATAANGPTADGPVPIFIVGMPRTGTTLLERVLGHHSQVASAGELNDFASALSWESDHFFASATDPRSIEKLRGIDFANVGRRYLQRTARHRAGCAYLIDKNPANFSNSGLIAKALPQAKIVCMLRSPMDACFSNLKELFAGDVYPYSYELVELADHYEQFVQTIAHWQRTLGFRFHVVRYEELVVNPEATARSALAFCGLDYQERCIDVVANTAPVATASSSQVRQPIHRGFVDAWTRYSDQLQPLQQQLERHRTARSNASDGLLKS